MIPGFVRMTLDDLPRLLRSPHTGGDIQVYASSESLLPAEDLPRRPRKIDEFDADAVSLSE